jgi:hypothetical protein
MSLEERSARAMTLVLVAVSAAYLTVVLGSVAGSPNRQEEFLGWAIGAAALEAILTVVTHVVPCGTGERGR